MIDGSRLGRHDYNQRLEELASAFSGLHGRVEYGSHLSDSGATIKLVIKVHLPGWFDPDKATMVFIEKHEWRGSAWERYAYLYDLHLEPRPRGRFAYHWHAKVFHVHCVSPADPQPGHHYRGSPVDDIFWAADELHRIFEGGIQCAGLVPLRDWVEDDDPAGPIPSAVPADREAPRTAAARARVLMAERLNEIDAAQELARADAWQLAHAQEAWRELLDGRLELAPPEGLARIFREAEQRAGGRPSWAD